MESLKSLIITSALVDRLITVERAVSLSRLETEFQVSQNRFFTKFHEETQGFKLFKSRGWNVIIH